MDRDLYRYPWGSDPRNILSAAYSLGLRAHSGVMTWGDIIAQLVTAVAMMAGVFVFAMLWAAGNGDD